MLVLPDDGGRVSAMRWGRSSRTLLALALVLSVASVVRWAPRVRDATSTNTGSDFVPFYAAGRMVLEGKGRLLYVPSENVSAYAQVFSDGSGSEHWRPFVYPPVMGLFYAAYAWLPFATAYLAQIAFLCACIAVAAGLLPRQDGWRPKWLWVAFVGSLTLALPFSTQALFLGQNAPIALLLVACIWRFSISGSFVLAGVSASLLLYKPQLALPWLCVFGALGSRRAVAGWFGGACAMYAASAAVSGWGWPLLWFPRTFAALELAAVYQSEAMALSEQLRLVSWDAGRLALTFAALGLIGVISAWVVRQKPWEIDAKYAVVGPLLLLIGPHAMHYESMAAIPAVVWVMRRNRTWGLMSVALIAAGSVHGVFAALGLFATSACAWRLASSGGAVAPDLSADEYR